MIWQIAAWYEVRLCVLLTSWCTQQDVKLQLWKTTRVNKDIIMVEVSWDVMAHAQKPVFVFQRNGRVHLNRRGGGQFSRLLAAEVCESALVMLDIPCSEVVWRVLATHSIRQFPPHFPSLRHRVPSHFNWILLNNYEDIVKGISSKVSHKRRNVAINLHCKANYII